MHGLATHPSSEIDKGVGDGSTDFIAADITGFMSANPFCSIWKLFLPKGSVPFYLSGNSTHVWVHCEIQGRVNGNHFGWGQNDWLPLCMLKLTARTINGFRVSIV